MRPAGLVETFWLTIRSARGFLGGFIYFVRSVTQKQRKSKGFHFDSMALSRPRFLRPSLDFLGYFLESLHHPESIKPNLQHQACLLKPKSTQTSTKTRRMRRSTSDVRKLFDRGHSEVLIHGMGPCITKALHLTQDVLLYYGERMSFQARHGTVELLDDAGLY